MKDMEFPSPTRLAKWGFVALAASQAITIAALSLVDSQRKKGRHRTGFPSLPPQELALDSGTVTIYTKGRSLYDAMLAAIEAATGHIYFETYIWKDDRVGQKFKDALIRAAERGVNVYIAYDVFGNLVVKQSFFRFPDSVHVLRHLPWSGIRGRIVRRSPGLNHRKLLIVDDAVGFIGGYNIGSLYANRWRDTHARITGEPALDLANAFVDYWNQTSHKGAPYLESPSDRSWASPIKVTRNVPSVGIYPIRYSYLEAIDRASDHIWLTHAYLIPDDDLTLALLEAADRGVDVRVVVPAESNHIVADWLSRGFYRLLLSRGIRLFLYQNAMVHAKTATIDGAWSTIGTANLDRLSLMGNYEINIEITDANVAAEMEDIFTMDSGNCVELTLEQWQHRPVAAKISEIVLTPLRPLL
jgi:cardiolipin synthase A/B